MEEFQLPVFYKGKEQLLTARLVQAGYVYKLEVDLPNARLLFEKDDEGAWRALLSSEDHEKGTKIDPELVKSIIETIELVLRS